MKVRFAKWCSYRFTGFSTTWMSCIIPRSHPPVLVGQDVAVEDVLAGEGDEPAPHVEVAGDGEHVPPDVGGSRGSHGFQVEGSEGSA